MSASAHLWGTISAGEHGVSYRLAIDESEFASQFPVDAEYGKGGPIPLPLADAAMLYRFEKRHEWVTDAAYMKWAKWQN